MNNNVILIIGFMAILTLAGCKKSDKMRNTDEVFSELANHNFHPLNQDGSMTKDRNLQKDGIANLNDTDWKVRLLAVRDLIYAGKTDVEEILPGLEHASLFVRHATAKALGIIKAIRAIPALEKVVENDPVAVVRSQAVIALGQMEAQQSLELLQKTLKEDLSKDVRHQCELAIYQIKNKMGVTDKNLNAWLELDETTFETVQPGDAAPDFVLEDTEGKPWLLSSFRNKNWVVLIWVFADWCPVCHGEFHDTGR